MCKEAILIKRAQGPCPICGEDLELGDHSECLEACLRPEAERYHEPIREDWYVHQYE